MTMLPLSERNLAVLEEEIKRLEATHKECEKALGPNLTSNSAEALKKIKEAIGGLQEELKVRCGI